MLIAWSNDYSIGNDTVDKQHREFFTRVHLLADEELKDIQEMLDYLKNYAIEHFQYEEDLMRQYEYPGVKDHAEIHVEFLNEYSKLADEFSKQGTSQDLIDKVAEMAQNWLINHISEVDRQYAKYIESRVQNKGKGIL